MLKYRKESTDIICIRQSKTGFKSLTLEAHNGTCLTAVSVAQSGEEHNHSPFPIVRRAWWRGVGGGGLPYDGVAYSFSLHAKESAVSCGWVGHLAPVQTEPLFLYMYNS